MAVGPRLEDSQVVGRDDRRLTRLGKGRGAIAGVSDRRSVEGCVRGNDRRRSGAGRPSQPRTCQPASFSGPRASLGRPARVSPDLFSGHLRQTASEPWPSVSESRSLSLPGPGLRESTRALSSSWIRVTVRVSRQSQPGPYVGSESPSE